MTKTAFIFPGESSHSVGMMSSMADDFSIVRSTFDEASEVLDYDWHKMNTTGCSLVWGHPQGPTLTRVVIEALEEAVTLGGGYVLVFGCAAGDVGIAAILKVTDEESEK